MYDCSDKKNQTAQIFGLLTVPIVRADCDGKEGSFLIFNLHLLVVGYLFSIRLEATTPQPISILALLSSR